MTNVRSGIIAFVLALYFITEKAAAQERSKDGYDDADKKSFVDAHNTHRGTVAVNEKASNMMKLTWDNALADSAKAVATMCPALTTKAKGQSIGSQLATGASQPKTVVDEWFADKANFTYSSMTCVAPMMCDNYMQLAWAKTEKVGCSIKFCPANATLTPPRPADIYLTVCQYDPSADLDEKTSTNMYMVGTMPCAGCQTRFCDVNLCGAMKPAISTTVNVTIGEKAPEQAAIDQFIVEHNDRRRSKTSKNMYKLDWDKDLAKAAYEYVKLCTDKGARNAKKPANSGENIGIEPALRGYDLAFPVDLWNRELQYLNTATMVCTTKCENGIQLAWAATTKVGCASKYCANYTDEGASATAPVYLTVCYYSPSADLKAKTIEEVYKTGVACADCTNCENGLCVFTPAPAKTDATSVRVPPLMVAVLFLVAACTN